MDDDIKRWRKHLFVTHTSLPLSTHRQESWESNNNNIINCNTRGATLLAFILSPDIISRCSCDIIRRRKAVTTTTAPTTQALSRLSTSSYFSCWIFDAFFQASSNCNNLLRKSWTILPKRNYNIQKVLLWFVSGYILWLDFSAQLSSRKSINISQVR